MHFSYRHQKPFLLPERSNQLRKFRIITNVAHVLMESILQINSFIVIASILGFSFAEPPPPSPQYLPSNQYGPPSGTYGPPSGAYGPPKPQYGPPRAYLPPTEEQTVRK